MFNRSPDLWGIFKKLIRQNSITKTFSELYAEKDI
jgi:hypothetical protein